MNVPIQLKPMYKNRVWGGFRLQPDAPEPVGEAWIVYEGCEVLGGDWQGSTLAEVARKNPQDLLGAEVVERTGDRFPLLIKVLDAHDWLSVQVHPNDKQAQHYEGPEEFGKTEAWYILESRDDAQLVAGLSGNPTRDDIRRAALDGTLERLLRFVNVRPGDVVHIPAGTVHAIGPGLLIYEVQQTSDTTYRLFDWNRPASAGRALHLDKGIEVIDLEHSGDISPAAGEVRVTCPYFTLEEVELDAGLRNMDTSGRSFHALTVIDGDVEVTTSGGQALLGSLETVVVPAAAGGYQIRTDGRARILLARVC